VIPDNIGERSWDRLYAGFFILVTLIWPIGLFQRGLEEGKPYLSAIPVLNTLLFALVWYLCSHPEMSLFRGLAVVSYASHTGCIQLTWMILPYTLAYALSAGLLFTLIGIFKGRRYAQERWLSFVAGFYGRALKRR
jgi:hypothetical protein